MGDKHSDFGEDNSNSRGKKMKKPEGTKSFANRDVAPSSDLWTDGLICAFEFIRGHKKSTNNKAGPRTHSRQTNGEYTKMEVLASRTSVMDSSVLDELKNSHVSFSDDDRDGRIHQAHQFNASERFQGSKWVPIGWERIMELVQMVRVDSEWASQQLELDDNEDDITVQDLAAPYWERPAGPIWWCHLTAGHPTVEAWLSNAQWLHPAISLALRDESRLISERMKYLLYEVNSLFYNGINSSGICFLNHEKSCSWFKKLHICCM